MLKLTFARLIDGRPPVVLNTSKKATGIISTTLSPYRQCKMRKISKMEHDTLPGNSMRWAVASRKCCLDRWRRMNSGPSI